MVNVLAIPVLVGRKTARERFAGATDTYTLEGMMGDGKALQLGTSHELGQNFARRSTSVYSAASGGREYAWTTSWGTSTRMLGGLIMCHGDDNGLRVPPRLAPVQAYVMVVKDGPEVASTAAAKLRDALRDAGVRVALDDRVDTAFGRRAVDAELKGYPVRVEVGPRDLAAGNVVVVRRTDGTKTPVPVGRRGRRRCSPRSTPTSRRSTTRRWRAGWTVPSRCPRWTTRSRPRPTAGRGCRGRPSASRERPRRTAGRDRTLPDPRRRLAYPTPRTSRTWSPYLARAY